MATPKQAGKSASARKAGPPGKTARAGQPGQARTAGRSGQARTAGQSGRPGQSGRLGPAGRTEQSRPASGAAPGNGAAQTGDEALAVPFWRRIASYPGAHKLEFSTMVASVLGLAVSVYLTIEHFTQNSYPLCPANSTFNCGKVTTSTQSHFLGMPVAVLGLAFFVFMVAVNSPWAWRASQPAVHWARLVSVIVGIVFVLYLVYAELFLINAICLYCTSVHILTFILFALIVARAAFSGVKPGPAKR